MGTVQESIEVEVPVSTAYNQWTQFEEFPKFMEGIEEVRQKDDRHLHWRATIGGKTEEWDAEITEQIRDQLIAWRSTNGLQNGGVVTFQPLGEDRTRIDVQLEWDDEGFMEKLGSAFGVDDRRVKGDLERFKELVESRGVETGAWRGEIRSS